MVRQLPRVYNITIVHCTTIVDSFICIGKRSRLWLGFIRPKLYNRDFLVKMYGGSGSSLDFQIVGNSVTYTVLHAFRTDELPTNASDANDTDISFCGSNDCQDPNLIQHTIDSYVPNRNATYIILGTMVAMYLTAMILFTFLLPPMKSLKIPATSTNIDKDSWTIKVGIYVPYTVYFTMVLERL